MKILKKINKGLILTIIVVLALIIYLTGVEKQRKADKADIRIACEKFIALTDKYLVLPENMQTLTGNVPKNQMENYEKEMKSELEKVMIDSEEAVKIQHIILKSNLEDGYKDTQNIRAAYKRTISKIKGYEFDGNTVTVTFNSKVEVNSKYLNTENEEQIKSDTFSPEGDEIQLQKIDGEWKITHADLQYGRYGVIYGNTLEIE